MGLSIHYGIKTPATSLDTAMQRVEAMRQLALDLPFDRVDDEVVHLGPEACAGGYQRYRGVDDTMFELLLSATAYIRAYSGRSSYPVAPEELAGFFVHPAAGSELAFIGLARYPEIFHPPAPQPERTQTPASSSLMVGRPGWQLDSSVKTQYASDPSFGGLAAFLRAHIGLVTLLERIGELPDVDVVITDEGKYGPSRYSTDWEEAIREGRDPTYERHPGRYDVQALADEVGRWNEHVAAVVGAFSDVASQVSGAEVDAPILANPEFERLEFRGQTEAKRRGVEAFLRLLAKLEEKDA